MHYHLAALPALLRPLSRYWANSDAPSLERIAKARAALMRRAVEEHVDLAEMAGSSDLIRRTGFLQVFWSMDAAEAAEKQASFVKDIVGGSFVPLRPPHLSFGGLDASPVPAAMFRPEPAMVSDPEGLAASYVDLLVRRGGASLTGDAYSLEESGGGWRVETQAGTAFARDVVVAMGAWSGDLTRRWGYRPPLFVKRGYHMHYHLDRGSLDYPIVDSANGFVLTPMQRGVRISTGAEFARRDAAPSPVQLDRVEPVARALLPGLGRRLDPAPWLGSRPCLPDMLPIIDRSPRVENMWFAFGYNHHGLTMAPASGRLLAQLMTGEAPFVDPLPYRATRFA
jgi:D-amino-acid dehydrogenase